MNGSAAACRLVADRLSRDEIAKLSLYDFSD